MQLISKLPAKTPAQHSGSMMRFRPVYMIPIIVLLIAVMQLFFRNQQTELEALHYNNLSSNLEVAYQETLIGYERAAQLIFSEIVNQPEVMRLYSRAYGADEAEQALIRTELYSMLVEDYNRLESMNLRQLHFYLPNNHSFLRFHEPSRYGDDMTGVLYTVEQTNATRTATFGFEEGRIYNGFRYVFPLLYGGRHIGSAEVSVSFNAIQQDFTSLMNGATNLMVRSDIVRRSLFADQLDRYIASDLTENYFYDRAVVENYRSKDLTWEQIEAINAALRAQPDFETRLTLGDAFSQMVTVDGVDYTTSFMPVINARGEHAAYVVYYRLDEFITASQASHVYSQLAVGLVGVSAIVFFWYIDRSTAFINRQRLQLATQNSVLESTNIALEDARTQAVTANQLKSQFLANMSHELRTPLNAILNFSQFVSSGMLGEVNHEQVDVLEKVNSNGKYLLSLINDLLDISKIEAGQLKLFVEDDVDLVKEFQAVADVAETALADKPVNLVLKVQDNLPLVTCDRRRMRQIMLNLVANACKFTDKGSVTLTLKHEGDILKFAVSDTGPGIAPQDFEAIFETFRQTEVGLKKGGGTGLGLSISRRLAEIHGGQLSFESVVGKGSTFYVTLPMNNPTLADMKLRQEVAVPA